MSYTIIKRDLHKLWRPHFETCTRRIQRIRTQGLYARDLEYGETRRRKTRHDVELNARQRGTPIFIQVQGPRGEIKPLRPAFLYYDAISREEYKVLVTKL
jgi:hypothetical protein